MDLEIPRPVTVIIGKSGKVKALPSSISLGLLKPSLGRVHVDGEDITEFQIDKLKVVRKKIGMLFSMQPYSIVSVFLTM